MALLALSWPAAGSSAPDPAQDQAGQQTMPLDRLSTTIGDLKASLSTIRQDLEALRGDPAVEDRRCAAPAAGREVAAHQLEQLRAQVEAERVGRQRSEAATAAELASLRQRLADAGSDAARLHGERAALVTRIAELEQTLAQARAGEAIPVPLRQPPALAIETAAAAELDAAAQPAAPVPTIGAPVSGAADIQLRAELALAQLRIADLTAELRSAQAGREAVETEIRSLRSLTDARIMHFMGWR